MPHKILVVDDEADLEVLIRQKFRKQIRENEYEFTFAQNGVEALSRIADHPDMGLEPVVLRDSPPLGVCTICIGKKEIGWKNHFGVIRPLDMPEPLYRGD